jgi:SAM-dependent methyltransferase
MAHPLLYGVVADLVKALDPPEPIVEFGSLQVEEGQPNDLRPLFAGREFVGTDLRPGPGVDRVEDLRDLSFGDEEIGTALCLDTLEHCEDPHAACGEMHRVLRPGGVCVISSVMLFGIHAYPSDFWRFTPEGLAVLLRGFDDVDTAGMGDPLSPVFVFGVGGKQRRLGIEPSQLPSLVSAQRDFDLAEGKIRLGTARYSIRELATHLRSELPRVVRERLARRHDP